MQNFTPNRPRRAPPRLPGGGSVCPNCQKALRTGAMFCTRCGTNVAQSAPAAFAPLPQAMPRPAGRKIAAAPPTRAAMPKRKRSVLGIFFVIMLLAVGLWVLAEWSGSYRSFPSGPFRPSEVPATEALSDSLLPVAPDPDTPLPLRTGANAAAIQLTWTETGVVDSSGAVGLRVHARVRTPASTPVHLVAHFFSVDTGAVKSDDPHYRDPVGQAAVASDTLPNGTVAEATVFIPLSALKLSGSEEHLKLLPALFDENNQPIATGMHIPFYFDRGSVYITAVHVDNLNGGARRLRYTVQAADHSSQIFGEAIVQFKDATGAVVPGWSPASNAAGKLMVKGQFSIPGGHGANTVDAPPIFLQPGISMLRPTAEIRLFDPSSGQWLSPALSVGVP